jgi:nicotinic acid phosphoribosyltransferase
MVLFGEEKRKKKKKKTLFSLSFTLIQCARSAQAWNKDKTDNRFLVWGIRWFVENYLLRRWTERDVERADLFYKTHNTGADGSYAPMAYPKELFLKFVRENDGYFPVKFQALRDGTAAHIHVPIYQVTASDEYAPLCTFLETLLTHIWYATNVATLSRRTRDLIEAAFARSVDDDKHFLVDSRLHDFGFRGATGVEAATVGGMGHLLSFRGSDTMSACYFAQFEYNGGKPVAMSVPATEHSVMTSWPSEEAAILNMIKHFGNGYFACVLDSYDYENCLTKVLPKIKDAKLAAGGFMTMRPDSGDPTEAVLLGLRKGEAVWGATTNSKGFKVLNGAAVIQGDGMTYDSIKGVLDQVLAAGYSAGSVLFGMGGGLLQRHNRDTMAFATKLSHIVYADGTAKDIMKLPKTDAGKVSFPGILSVKSVAGVPTIFPLGDGPADAPELLVTMYDKGPVKGFQFDDFDATRARAIATWPALPKLHNPVSAELKAKCDRWIADKRAFLASYGK